MAGETHECQADELRLSAYCGGVVQTGRQTTYTSYLRHALEVLGDAVGHTLDACRVD